MGPKLRLHRYKFDTAQKRAYKTPMGSTLSVAAKLVKFTCLKCGQHIEAVAEGEGSAVDCPACKEKLTIPKRGQPTLRADCPRCAQKLRIPPESGGTEIDCPVCTHKFKAPTAPPPKPKLKLPSLPKIPRWAMLVALFVCAGMGIAIYLGWTRSPQYSLLQVKRSVEQHDFATFQKYVDIDSVATRLIDDLMVLGILESADEDKTATAISAGLIQLVKPRLVDEAKKQLNRFVEVGKFGETNKVVMPFQQLKDDGEFLGVVSEKHEGKIAVLGLGLTNRSERTSSTIEIKLRNMGAYWQVAEISNIKELVQRQKAEAEAKFNRLNATTIDKMQRLVKVAEIRKVPISDQYGIRRR